MLGRTSSLAMIPKSRGIISRHLTEQEYEELMHKRNVNEIGIYLRNHPYFHDSFVGIQEPDIHRERLEDLLSRDIYYKFESLRRYDFSSGKFAHFFLIDCEVHELLYALHLLTTGGAESYIIRLPGFLTNQTSFDLIGLAHARNFTEFLAVVRHTPYYGLLRPLLSDVASFDYAACEHALRSYYYTETLELIDKNFPAKERPAVRELFTREAEIYNLDLIYRIKSFFPGSYTPKEIEELLLRTENILRLHGYKNNLLRVGDVELDAEAHIVRKAGREITLTPKEFELLHFLLRNKGVALSRFALYERVWNDGESGDTRTLDIHITRLRKKLGLENEIATVHKLGYIIREKT